MSYAATYPNKIVFNPALGREGKVRYGTSTLRRHTLSQWYSASGIGQTDTSGGRVPLLPFAIIGGGALLLTVLGAKGAERAQRGLYANRRRPRRNRRRR